MSIGDFFSSAGLKRKAASYLAIVLQVVLSIPGLEDAAKVLEYLIGTLGGVGLVQAAQKKTLKKVKLATAASLLGAVATVLSIFPLTAPYASFLLKLASILGAAQLGRSFKEKQLETIDYYEQAHSGELGPNRRNFCDTERS